MIDINGITTFDNIGQNGQSLKDLISDRPVYLAKHFDILCLRGGFTFNYRGQEYTAREQSFTMLVKESLFRFISFTDDCVIALMGAKTSALHMNASPMYNLVIFMHYFQSQPVLALENDEMSISRSVYLLVKEVSTLPSVSYCDEICMAQHASLFLMLMGHVDRIMASQWKSSGRQRELYRTFITNVTNNCREQRSLEFYASLQCVSSKHLSAAIKRESGVCAHQIIADYVIMEAKELLEHKNLSIQDVSARLNFPNQAFFCKYFKAHEGISPLSYRNKLTGE